MVVAALAFNVSTHKNDKKDEKFSSVVTLAAILESADREYFPPLTLRKFYQTALLFAECGCVCLQEPLVYGQIRAPQRAKGEGVMTAENRPTGGLCANAHLCGWLNSVRSSLPL